ncbi:Hint domain-containing protein [Litoreibacter roseus]|uniref:Hedgehog/Intein (Hint) domain-containing protein n=1 Tax=Litoreibacter roseus TaxID=2601869 RepID=A0A6N6JER9_9RHOB|nr:Hint domain-containing protein [Litoreibacter roseus]GFE63712.1 hypothetical protein KIN_07860 [Litoreibacter roseus]
MPNFFIWSNSDLGIGSLSNAVNGGNFLVGAGEPSVARVSDDEGNFDDDRSNNGQVQDPNLNQFLTENLVVDGATLGTTGETIYNAAESRIINNTTGEIGRLLYVTVGGTSGNDFVGYALTIPVSEGDVISISNFSVVATQPYSTMVACFARGTLIETTDGHVAVEALFAGQEVMTQDRGPQPIRWVGSTRVAAEGDHAPIVIGKGMFQNTRDLVVSPQHRILLRGWQAELLFGETEILVAAKHLTTSDRVYVRSGGEIEYFHILFDQHEIIYAECAACESFHPGAVTLGGLDTDQREELYGLFPDLRFWPDSFGQSARLSVKGQEAATLGDLAH